MIDGYFVRRAYEKPQVIEAYKKNVAQGLWPEETKIFKEYLNKKMTVLDIGCGTGRATFQLAKITNKTIGIDFVPEMINAANQIKKENHSNAKFYVGNALNLKVNSKIFDAVVFAYNGINTIPQNKNRMKALSEIQRVLKNEGVFIFSSHIRKCFDSKLFFYWINQFFKVYVFSFWNKKQEEMGDRLSYRFERYQYINIPSYNHLCAQLLKSGFIIEKILKKVSNKQEYPITIFVCKKKAFYRSESGFKKICSSLGCDLIRLYNSVVGKSS